MKKVVRRFLLAMLFAGPARAQPVEVEVFGGMGWWFPFLDTGYDASYTPSRVVGIDQLFEEPDPRSRARQLLRLQGRTGPGLALGVNVYPHRVLGFQFLLDRASVKVGGENAPHDVSLVYDSIAFPAPDRVVRQAELSFAAPDTEGSLDELALSFNATARFPARRAVSGSVSGGLTYARFNGEAETLGAVAAWLGGHAVLFSELFEMSYAITPAESLGFNVGANVDFSLGSHASVFVDGRLLHAPKTETSLRLERFISGNVTTVPHERIETSLELPPIEIDPSYLRILFGVKWKL